MRFGARSGLVACGLGLAGAASHPALAVPVTFAQFQQVSTVDEPFTFTSSGNTAGLTTVASRTPVLFSFLRGNLLGSPLMPGLTGSLPALLSFAATATAGPGSVFADAAYQTVPPRGSATDAQPFDSLTAAFKLVTPYNGYTNLLTLTATPENVGTVNQNQPTLSGTQNSHAATLDGGTVNLGVTFTSDFLDFTNTRTRDFAFSFTAVNPDGVVLNPGATFLSNFVADATGTFDSDPPPTVQPSFGVSEPMSVAILMAGIAGVLAMRRRA